MCNIKLSKKMKDLTGKRFGRLVAKYPSRKVEKNRLVWFCECDCGNTLEVLSRSLTTNNTKSCGCLQRDKVIEANSKGFNNFTISEDGLYAIVYLEHYDRSIAAEVFIDKCVIDKVSHLHWLLDKDRYAVSINNKHRILMHRLLLQEYLYDDLQVDHINGNRLDNRLYNLRVVTPQINKQNITITRSKSGYKGVCKNGKKWSATITVNKKSYYLGVFNTPEEAAIAYNDAAKRLIPFKIKLNKIPKDNDICRTCEKSQEVKDKKPLR